MGNAEATLPIKLKGAQKKNAEAAVGTKSLDQMFSSVVPDKKKESKQSINQSSSDVPPRKEES